MKGKNPNMILKIHLEKVFDRLECAFIKNTFQVFNFPPNLVKLIMLSGKLSTSNHLEGSYMVIPCALTFSSCIWRDSLGALN